MNKSLNMMIVLVATGLFSGGILSVVYQKTKPEIEYQKSKVLKEGIFAVLPDAVDYKEIKKGELVVYQGIDKDGKKIGIAFLGEGSGFQGKIRMIIGVDQKLRNFSGVRILESIETPGLGGKIMEEGFQKQFKGIIAEAFIEYVKNRKPEKSNEIQAITGATISSKAVVDIINQRIEFVKQLMKSDTGE